MRKRQSIPEEQVEKLLNAKKQQLKSDLDLLIQKSGLDPAHTVNVVYEIEKTLSEQLTSELFSSNENGLLKNVSKPYEEDRLTR